MAYFALAAIRATVALLRRFCYLCGKAGRRAILLIDMRPTATVRTACWRGGTSSSCACLSLFATPKTVYLLQRRQWAVTPRSTTVRAVFMRLVAVARNNLPRNSIVCRAAALQPLRRFLCLAASRRCKHYNCSSFLLCALPSSITCWAVTACSCCHPFPLRGTRPYSANQRQPDLV